MGGHKGRPYVSLPIHVDTLPRTGPWMALGWKDRSLVGGLASAGMTSLLPANPGSLTHSLPYSHKRLVFCEIPASFAWFHRKLQSKSAICSRPRRRARFCRRPRGDIFSEPVCCLPHSGFVRLFRPINRAKSPIRLPFAPSKEPSAHREAIHFQNRFALCHIPASFVPIPAPWVLFARGTAILAVSHTGGTPVLPVFRRPKSPFPSIW